MNRFAHRLSVTSRVIAAFIGGYGVTTLAIICFSLILPMEMAEAVYITSVLSFVLWALIIMAVFHAKTAMRAWLYLVISAAILGTASYILMEIAQ